MSPASTCEGSHSQILPLLVTTISGNKTQLVLKHSSTLQQLRKAFLDAIPSHSAGRVDFMLADAILEPEHATLQNLGIKADDELTVVFVNTMQLHVHDYERGSNVTSLQISLDPAKLLTYQYEAIVFPARQYLHARGRQCLIMWCSKVQACARGNPGRTRDLTWRLPAMEAIAEEEDIVVLLDE